METGVPKSNIEITEPVADDALPRVDKAEAKASKA